MSIKARARVYQQTLIVISFAYRLSLLTKTISRAMAIPMTRPIAKSPILLPVVGIKKATSMAVLI